MKKYKLLHREIAVTPLTLGIVHRGFHHKLQLKYTAPLFFKKSISVYSNLKSDWYGDAANFESLGFAIINKSQADIHFRDRLFKDTIASGKRLNDFSRKINQTDLKKLTNRQIGVFLLKLYNLGSDLCDFGMVAAAPDVAFSNFSRLLKGVTNRAAKNTKNPRLVNEYLNILTSSGKGSLTQEENSAILRLALGISQDKTLLKLFKNKPLADLTVILEVKYKKVWSKLIKIKNKYQWLSFGHLGPVKEISGYLEDLINVLNAGKIKEKIRSINEDRSQLKFKQARYFQELKLSATEKQLFKTAQNFSYNKAYRYDQLLYAYFTLNKLLREISGRTDLALNDLLFLSPEEISLFLQGREAVKRAEIKERQKFCVVLIKGAGVMFLTGLKAKDYLKNNIEPEKTKRNLAIIHGMAAYLGRVTGRVKILNNVRDMAKIEPGDILVAAQTTPDLIPAMKKAAAFVTDIGGITSHAAIVAREMKKPCIIGTKIATQILKDGDLVEVNANEGDVTKL